MAWDFSSDSVKLNDVSKELKQVATDLRTKTKEIYNMIENDLGAYWKSSTYNEFVAGCGTYKVPLEELVKTLELFGDKITNVSTNTDNLISDISSKVV